jgi:hypothetical protein
MSISFTSFWSVGAIPLASRDEEPAFCSLPTLVPGSGPIQWNSSIPGQPLVPIHTFRRSFTSLERSLGDGDVTYLDKRAEDGRQLWTDLTNALMNQPEDAPCLNFDDHYQVKDEGKSGPPHGLEEVFQHENLPDEDVYAFYDAIWHEKAGDPSSFVRGQFSQASGPEAGVLVAVSSNRGVVMKQGPDGTEVPDLTPDGKLQFWVPEKWPRIAWALWQTACSKAHKPSSNLNWIFQNNIFNKKTLEVLNKPYGGTKPEEATDVKTYTPTDPEFFDLLASPNGVGPVKLLIDHVQTLQKTIESISVQLTVDPDTDDLEWQMWLKLKPYAQ